MTDQQAIDEKDDAKVQILLNLILQAFNQAQKIDPDMKDSHALIACTRFMRGMFSLYPDKTMMLQAMMLKQFGIVIGEQIKPEEMH